MNKVYTLDLVDTEDGTGDVAIQFSKEFLKDQDWRVDDRITFSVEGEQIILRNIDWTERESLSK
jgi:hypothetical protein